MGADDHATMTLRVHGHVQGVGFRWWVARQLEALGLTGTATNLPDGTVEIVAEGERRSLERLERSVAERQTPGRVTGTTVEWHPVDDERTAEHGEGGAR